MNYNISFYLRTPHATGLSAVYVYVGNKAEGRVKIPTGENFFASYCNSDRRKGKELPKRNTRFYLEYTLKISSIRDALMTIEIDLTKEFGKRPTPDQIKAAYLTQIGKNEDASDMSFNDAFQKYIDDQSPNWSEGFAKTPVGLLNHLKTYQTIANIAIPLKDFSSTDWQGITQYFVGLGQSNSTINKNLKNVKQFLRWAGTEERRYFLNVHYLDNWGGLDEIESFKIALQEAEVEAMIAYDFSNDPRLDRARDLFILEVLTGQRHSDVNKVFDLDNHDGKFIRITQQKTGFNVDIPKHGPLVEHLDLLLTKYPDGFPEVSNQKFNDALKEVGAAIGGSFNKKHKWTTISGKTKSAVSDYRYNLVTSHTGRRTFCTMAIKAGIPHEVIMKVSGHQKYEHFKKYVKVDDEDVSLEFREKFSVVTR